MMGRWSFQQPRIFRWIQAIPLSDGGIAAKKKIHGYNADTPNNLVYPRAPLCRMYFSEREP
jgi:hypothetical protein